MVGATLACGTGLGCFTYSVAESAVQRRQRDLVGYFHPITVAAPQQLNSNRTVLVTTRVSLPVDAPVEGGATGGEGAGSFDRSGAVEGGTW